MATPRNKEVKPDLVEVFTDEDGNDFTIEIYSSTDQIYVGRGAYRKNQSQDRFLEALEIVVDDYLTAKGPKKPKSDYMDSPSKFAREMLLRMKSLDSDISDTSSLRKTLYPEVKLHLMALTNAVNKNNARYKPKI